MGVWWLEFKYPKVVKKPKGRALNYLYIFFIKWHLFVFPESTTAKMVQNSTILSYYGFSSFPVIYCLTLKDKI